MLLIISDGAACLRPDSCPGQDVTYIVGDIDYGIVRPVLEFADGSSATDEAIAKTQRETRDRAWRRMDRAYGKGEYRSWKLYHKKQYATV